MPTHPGSFGFLTRSACPVCQASGGRVLLDLPLHEPPMSNYLKAFYRERIAPLRLRGGRYTLLECARCGLIYQREVPGLELLKDLYESSIEATSLARPRTLRERQRHSRQVEQLLSYFRLPPSEVQVLDYGAGRGDWLTMAAAYGCRTFAVEYSTHRSHRLANQGHELLDLLGLPTERFHFVNAEQVFEHLIEPRETAHRLVAALRPGGILRISVPNGSRVKARLKQPDWLAPKGSSRSLNAVAPLEHINCYSYESVLTLGRLAGASRFACSHGRHPGGWSRVLPLVASLRQWLRRPRGIKVYFSRP